jgi:hypothetical protein
MDTTNDVDVTENAQTFLKFLEAQNLDDVIAKTRVLIVKMKHLPREERDQYLKELDNMAFLIGRSPEKLSKKERDRYMGAVMNIYDSATRKKNKIGGIAGFVIHHKILSFILLVAIIIVIAIVKK